MREPRYAGLFYEAGENTLKQQLQWCFEHEKGPGATPPPLQKLKKAPLPKGVIVPHAGYSYSGPCAAWAYKALGEAPLADVYIILSPSHHSLRSGLTQEPFKTPLGIVRVDQDFARRLLEKGTIREDDELHADEHAIEVQLPFLQFIHQDRIEKIRILPIIISHDIDLKRLAIDIKETIIETGKKAVIIASSDFTHYGRNYHYVPFSTNIQENIAKLDEGAIERIRALDPEGLLAYADKTMITMCGLLPVTLLLMTVKAKKVNLEQYYTSAAMTGDEKNSVSYASIVFY